VSRGGGGGGGGEGGTEMGGRPEGLLTEESVGVASGTEGKQSNSSPSSREEEEEDPTESQDMGRSPKSGEPDIVSSAESICKGGGSKDGCICTANKNETRVLPSVLFVFLTKKGRTGCLGTASR
jgi:hypothetical protein